MFKENEKIILKGIGGFYYVKTADGVLEAKAKGIFRRQGITPLAGDRVELEESNGDYVISKIYERSNLFLRPPAANVDRLLLVVSATDPEPNLLVLDKLIAISCKKSIEPILLFTKTDIVSCERLRSDYETAGFTTLDIRSDPDSLLKLRDIIAGHFSIVSGNSGVGKSTLLTQLGINGLETQQTSKKLGRGKHTTRSVEIFELFGGYIADTPGFSAVDIERGEPIMKEQLPHLFKEFAPYIDECEFRDCSHTVERGCAVLKALEEGKIVKSRHDNYCELYKAAKELNDWEYKK